MTQAKLETFLERLQKASSIRDLQTTIVALRNIYEVEHVIYHTVNQKGEQFGALTYDMAWVTHYLEQDYRFIDPVILGAWRRFNPMDWKQLDWSSPVSRAFLRESQEAGVGNQGYSVPIWGPQGELALFTVNHRANDQEWQTFTKAHLRDFLLVSHFVHQQGRKIRDMDLDAPVPELSPRERDVLTLLCLGRSRAAAAERLKISENTLRAYVDSARHKLGAMNTIHAVALALARGVIHP